MMRSKIVGYVGLLMLVPLPALGATNDTSRRVQPPQWSQDVLDAFFDDAREQLVGQRPTGGANNSNVAGPIAPTSGQPPSNDAAEKWSALVDGETLTAEIKRLNIQLNKSLDNASAFQGGGNINCRRDFGMLAVWFGIVAQYDGDVRWQSAARLMQAKCTQAERNCKAPSAQSFAAVQTTHTQLEDLIRGQAPTGEPTDEPTQIDRTLLMQNMELALKEQLAPTMANSREFRRRTQQTSEQAQLVAVLAEVIQQEGYEYADDETFLDEARQLREAARNLADAAREKDYEAARTAFGQVTQSCSTCHEGYRG